MIRATLNGTCQETPNERRSLATEAISSYCESAGGPSIAGDIYKVRQEASPQTVWFVRVNAEYIYRDSELNTEPVSRRAVIKSKDSKTRLSVLEHSARTAVCAMASLLAAKLFRLPEAYWAPITTVVIAQSTLGAAFSVSWKRLVGTALGALVGGLLASFFPPNVFVFGATVLILGPLSALLSADRNAYRFGGVTLSIVLLIPRAEPPWQVALHRFAEVSIGIGVALLFATVWPEGEDPEPGK